MDVIPYLDRHLVYPLLDFLQSNNAHSEEEMLKAKFELLEHTNMPGHCAELYKQIHHTSDAPARFAEKSADIDRELQELEKSSEAILGVLENPEVAGALKQDKSQNLAFLRDTHGISMDQINILYKLGQFEYNRGNYGGAGEHLYHFRVLSTDHKLIMSATWGKLASEILTANWEEAQAELTKLKEQIDGDSGDSLAQLKNRTWLLHWALFPLYKSGTLKANELQELFFSPAYLNAIQTNAPHLLRYLTAAMLVSSSGKVNQQTQSRRLKEVVRLVQSEKNSTDAIVKFAVAMFVTYDYAGAAALIPEVEQQAKTDYFLADTSSELAQSLRVVLTETYLRLHRSTELKTLENLTGLQRPALLEMLTGELSHLDADIDEEDGIVEVIKTVQSSTVQDAVQKIVERTQATQMRNRLASIRV